MTRLEIGLAIILFFTQLFLHKHVMGDSRTALVAQYCNNQEPESGSALADYFVPAMDSLYTNVSSNGYGTAGAGSGPNAVFGLGQCLEDLGSIDCQLCFGQVRSLLPKCYPNTGGRIYLDGCFGRYANYSFFGEALDAYDTKVCNSTLGNSTDHTFYENVQSTVNNVTVAGKRRNGYAVGSSKGSNVSVYVMVQCWEVLNQSACNTCLDAAAASVLECVPALEGRALFSGCYIRYSNRLFWNSDDTGSGSSGNHNLIWIILGPCLGVIFIVVGILIWKRKLIWRKSSAESLLELYSADLPPGIMQSSLNFKYGELKKATDNFNLSNKLGQGSNGAVFKAVLSDGKEVAVKRLFLNTRQWAQQFFNEVDLISQVRHRNLVKLLGCSLDGPESLLVYEFYPNRSLDLFLFDSSKERNLNWSQRLNIIQGVAEGLSYLHEESEMRIIHRDIKASNILLDDKFKPKITDFGLARAFSEDKTHLTTGVAGTLGYMAPEYVVHGHLSEKADVYSFGVLVLEIVTGKRCSGSFGSHSGHLLLSQVWNHYRSKTMEKIADKEIYRDSLKEEILSVVQIGLQCTQSSPADRPTMSKVVELIRSRSHDAEVVINDPPFLKIVDMFDHNLEEGENSRLISHNSGSGFSSSGWSRLTGR
ncbi:hypothetical protein LUZ63_014740 [Rhynchospora breviuscula]|uniref:Cysteine-rich receptor-like protein kinase 2 n=1 Tax=Rhynchospora breviuscula TaxID=2022672 RepID=A0A9Q0HM50_9POAL|nr:hypothetical protein LUZ63_014740 [Rhynchospora breviuscula]